MKNILIIGGSSGIGKAIALDQAKKGNEVFSTHHTSQGVEGPNIENIKLDVRNQQNYDWLPARIDSLVYCPGAIDLKPFHRIKKEDFLSDFELQVMGAIEVIQAALPALKKSSNASITLFSTVAVQNGFPFHSKVAVSKGAIEGLTRSLAAEYAPTIRVNAVAPSLTNTPLAGRLLSTEDKVKANDARHPMKRIGQPEDIAHAVDFLINSSWTSGEILHVDGGMSSLKTS